MSPSDNGGDAAAPDQAVGSSGVISDRDETNMGAIGESEAGPKKKKRLSWSIVIGVLAGVVVLTGVGVFLGVKLLGNKDEKVVIEAEKPLEDMDDDERQAAIEADKKFAIGSLSDLYDYQMVRAEKIGDEDRSCYKVTGLKEKTIEDKINNELEAAFNGVDAGKSVRCEIEGNFGGILSARVVLPSMDANNRYTESIVTSFNWRLDTGEQVEFDDLFLKGTNIARLISDEYYKSELYKQQEEWCDHGMVNESDGYGSVTKFIREFGYWDNDKCYDHAMRQVDMDEVSRAANIYNTDGIQDFYFTPYSVSFKINGVWVQALMEAFWDKVAIYKRYIGDWGETVNVNNFVLSQTVGLPGTHYMSVSKEDNLYIIDGNINDKDSYNDVPDAVKVAAQSYMEGLPSKIREYATEHKDKIIVMTVGFGPDIYCHRYSGEITCSFSVGAYQRGASDEAVASIAKAMRIPAAQWSFAPYEGDWQNRKWEFLGVTADKGLGIFLDRVIMSENGDMLGASR